MLRQFIPPDQVLLVSLRPVGFQAPLHFTCHAGAGWGGCVVALVATPSVAAFMQQVDQEYYQPLASSGRLQSQPLLKQQPMFVTVPAGGASVALL